MDKISGARAPRQEVLSFMTKIDIFSGFLGAGKTTLIKKLIAEAYTGEKIVLIENEFGEIAIDGGFLKDSGVQINEMNSGCICCSLVGDFADALQKVLTQFHPDRILIEPSGVGKLSDVIRAVQGVQSDELVLNGFTTVVDANKCKMYMKNFGEFFNNQVENASAIILSRTEGIRPEKPDRHDRDHAVDGAGRQADPRNDGAARHAVRRARAPQGRGRRGGRRGRARAPSPPSR